MCAFSLWYGKESDYITLYDSRSGLRTAKNLLFDLEENVSDAILIFFLNYWIYISLHLVLEGRSVSIFSVWLCTSNWSMGGSYKGSRSLRNRSSLQRITRECSKKSGIPLINLSDPFIFRSLKKAKVIMQIPGILCGNSFNSCHQKWKKSFIATAVKTLNACLWGFLSFLSRLCDVMNYFLTAGCEIISPTGTIKWTEPPCLIKIDVH